MQKAHSHSPLFCLAFEGFTARLCHAGPCPCTSFFTFFDGELSRKNIGTGLVGSVVKWLKCEGNRTDRNRIAVPESLFCQWPGLVSWNLLTCGNGMELAFTAFVDLRLKLCESWRNPCWTPLSCCSMAQPVGLRHGWIQIHLVPPCLGHCGKFSFHLSWAALQNLWL